MANETWQPPAADRRASWISRGFEALLDELPQRRKDNPGPDFDVLIVGSGYGGAIAADRLAGRTDQGRPLRIAVLERGREHLAGSFPDRAADLPGHVRFTTPNGAKAGGRLEGLFDMRIGADVSVLLANGVGGGSLINAGVMAFPSESVFESDAWPAGLKHQGAVLRRRADRLAVDLGVKSRDGDGSDVVRPGLQRVAAMGQLGAATVPITVALHDRFVTTGHVELNRCIACGDCATGCNHGAKASLDVGLLRRAERRGVEIFSGATVTRVRPGKEGGWKVEVWHTDATLRARMPEGARITARRVILAAGTLGSTEILMRSQSTALTLSPQLGRHFSANGDLLATVVSEQTPFNGVADENVPPKQRQVGPTITSMIDLRATDRVVVQDLDVPGPLVRLFEEGMATASLFQQLDQPDRTEHVGFDRPGAQAPDPMAVDPAEVQRCVVVALIARDDASGVMTAKPQDDKLPLDAGVRIDWRELRNDKAFDAAHDAFRKRLGGQDRLLFNPMWRLLSPQVEAMLGAGRGPLLTVHPLGGCRMADDRNSGVVDRDGRVFNGQSVDPSDVLDGLVVLDGSILPGSLGINPALTIATLADVAVRRLICAWGLRRAPRPAPLPQPGPRPVFATRAGRAPPHRTEVQVIEKLAGPVDLAGTAVWFEVSLVYAARELFPPPAGGGSGRPAYTQQGHVLPVALDDSLSRVRVFPWREGMQMPEDPDDALALLIVPIGPNSTLRFFHREPSTASQRRCRAVRAWFWNRGLRDSTLALIDLLFGRTTSSFNPIERATQSLNLATRAGEVRLFDYELKLGDLAPPLPGSAAAGQLAQQLFGALKDRRGLELKGSKRFTYDRRGNPWTQLTRLELREFAGLPLGARRSIDVRPDYFSRKQMPLLRVVGQQDQPSALIDLLCFGLYLARVFVNVHLWSGRKPDDDWNPRPARRLPGRLPGLPEPEEHEFVPDALSSGTIRLTRYPRSGSTLPPVLMIHGYSASGTTFAHPSLRPSLVEYLWRKGREPWVLDLRTSCGMPTAEHGYTFEEIARADIPAAVREVCARTGRPQLDVVSHCMGSVMLAMTMRDQGFPHAAATAARLRRWVMSPFGPVMRFAPANLLRAYLISWFRQALPDYRYSLRPGHEAVGVDGSMYDRIVATLPYLAGEFDIENPALPWQRVPWVGTRHRLDALIGRTFDSRNMDRAVLEHIDDFFGPLNLTTISQPIYFAHFGEPAEHTGRKVFGDDPSLLLRNVPMLSLHGMTNGLADPEGSATMLEIWSKEYGLNLEARRFAGMGHQDLFIGTRRESVFECIGAFLNSD